MRTSEAVAEPRVAEPRMSRAGRALTVAGIAMLGAAGLVLWASQSETLFASYLVSALAGCF